MTPAGREANRWLRVEVIIVIAVAIIAAVAAAVSIAGKDRPVSDRQQSSAGGPRAIAGGQFEASGIAHIPGGSKFLVVDDGTTREIFLVELAPDGTQRGIATPISLGADVTDIEGITWDGTYYYVVGSQSKPTGYEGDGLVRFVFDTLARRAERVERIGGLKAWLAENVAELHGTGSLIGDHILNIEALAWDPAGQRLLLGLRAPVVDGQALIVPIRLADPAGPFSRANLRVDGPALRVDLGGEGIRSLEYDPEAKAYRLITGATLNEETREFRIVEWDGRSGSPVRVLSTYSRSIKPEGIARATIDGKSRTVIVFDVGTYVLVD